MDDAAREPGEQSGLQGPPDRVPAGRFEPESFSGHPPPSPNGAHPAGYPYPGAYPRPAAPFQVVKVGQAVRARPESEVFVADDGWYFFITLAIGLLAGVLAWLPRSGRGWLMPVALAVGGVAGALVARVFGEWLTPELTRSALQQIGATVLFPVRLKAQAAVVVEAFAAVVVYLILVGFAERDDLGND